MIIIEVVFVIAFLIFLVGAGVGIFFMCVNGTEVGKAIDEKLASIIRRGEDEPQTSKTIEAYAKGFEDGAEAVKGIKDKQSGKE